MNFTNNLIIDETVINGANLFFLKQFGIEHREWIAGLVNSAPYLCCFTVGCWLTHPLNQQFGRRNTIFITCLISFATCLWQGFTNSWPHMFVARFMLGLGIGPKSSTVPVYAAECSPPAIRGALVMMWQMYGPISPRYSAYVTNARCRCRWTAFGIMLGYIADVAFYNVKDPPHASTSDASGQKEKFVLTKTLIDYWSQLAPHAFLRYGHTLDCMLPGLFLCRLQSFALASFYRWD